MPADSARDSLRIHAGFWRRLSAAGVDVVVAYVAAIPLMLVAVGISHTPPSDAVLFSGIALYLVFFFALASRGATPGKHAFGIVVRSKAGARPTFPQAFTRAIVLVATCGLGLLPAAFTPRKQGLHDLAAGTLVVRRSASPEEIREGGGTMEVGFTVGFVILVVLALPFAGAYFYAKIRADYVERARAAAAGVK